MTTTDHELNVQAGKLCDDAISTDGTTVWMWQADISDWREFSPATSIEHAMDLLDMLPSTPKWKADFAVHHDHVWIGTVGGRVANVRRNYEGPTNRARAITEAFVAATKAEASG